MLITLIIDPVFVFAKQFHDQLVLLFLKVSLVDLFREPECSGGKSTLVTCYCLFVLPLSFYSRQRFQLINHSGGKRELEDSLLSVSAMLS